MRSRPWLIFAAVLVALALAWMAAQPLFAFQALAAAGQSGDRDRLEQLVDFPAVREWVSFTTERTTERTLALIVGVAARQGPADVAAFLRPLDTEGRTQAHVHCALFPYRPVQRGELRFEKTVPDLLTSVSPSGVLHLMPDKRPFEGVGETDLLRGACWLGALPTITRMRRPA